MLNKNTSYNAKFGRKLENTRSHDSLIRYLMPAVTFQSLHFEEFLQFLAQTSTRPRG